MTESKKPEFSCTYGPVPSRRLGFSLGVDVLPSKLCSFNCIYCQLGPTARNITRRKEYVSASIVISQIQEILKTKKNIDYITFSGSGEPTLNSKIGQLIQEIKSLTDIPVAVLTNSSLLTRKSVREALKEADLVVPSLDAATQDVFIKVNRPYPSFRIEKIIQGLKEFRRIFKGSLWLEVMLVKGVNDSSSHILELKKAITEINPDKVQLNTVVRPPAEEFAQPLSLDKLKWIRKALGKKCEIIADFPRKKQLHPEENLEKAIVGMIRRRPVTLADISSSLGKHKNEIIKHLDILIKEKRVRAVIHEGLTYYELEKHKTARSRLQVSGE